MHISTGSPPPARPGSRAVVTVVACLLVAGLGLAVFVGRAVLQERSVAEREQRDAAASAARRAADELLLEWRRWESLVPRATSGNDDTFVVAPSPDVQRAIDPDAVVLLVSGAGVDAWPRGRLLYEASPPAAPAGAGARLPAIEAAERLELREKDYARAAAAYRALAASGDPDVGAAAATRLARTLRKAGKPAEALGAIEALIRARPSDDGPAMAAAWVDRCAVLEEMKRTNDVAPCALSLLAGLLAARWRLERPLYDYYSGRAHEWLQNAAGHADVSERFRLERERLALTDAAYATVERWRAATNVDERGPAGPEPATAEAQGHLLQMRSGAPFLAAWRANHSGSDFGVTILVLGPAALASEVWQPLASRAAQASIVSISANGAEVYSAADSRSTDGDAHGATETASIEDGQTVWRVTARSSPSGALQQRSAVRTRLYFGALALMLGSVFFAGFLAIRVLRRELAVARLQSEFVSAVSHEFRSPLSAITHLAELLDADRVVGEDRRREYYRLIVGEAGRLGRLVENLLDFARIEEGRARFEMAPLDIAPWLEQVAEEFRRSQAAAGRTIDVSCATGLPLADGDAKALQTVVTNLLDNAVKYSPGSDTVRVEATPADDGIDIRVHDNGPGIPEDERARIFERFFRGRSAGTAPGTGLGLALVQRIVAAHGGRVSVACGAEGGTTFTVHLPARSEGQA